MNKNNIFSKLKKLADRDDIPTDISLEIREMLDGETSVQSEKDVNLVDRVVDEILLNVSRKLLSTISFKRMSELLLEGAKLLTNSPFGFVGYIDLKTGSLKSPTLTSDIWAECKAPEKGITFPNFKGLYGWVLEHKTHLISNNPSEDSRSIGVPEGHIPIRRFISVPVLLNHNLVGQISLANSKSNYTYRDVSILNRLANIYALAIERVRNEKNIRRLSRAIYQNPSMILMTDIEGQIDYVNFKFTEMTGYSYEEILGKKINRFITTLMPSHMKNKVWLDFIQGENVRKELYWQNKDGEIIWVEMTVTPIKNRNGNISNYLVIMENITLRKRLEFDLQIKTEKIREEKSRVEKIINSISEGVLFIENDGSFSHVNTTFLEILSPIYKEKFPESIQEFRILKTSLSDLLVKIFYGKIEGNFKIEPVPGLFLEIRSIIVQSSFYPDKSLGMVVEISDITENVKFDNLRNQFVSMVSHELRTPITSINLAIQTYRRYKDKMNTEQHERLLNSIEKGSIILTKMIEDLLVISRIESSKIQLKWEKFDLTKAIYDLLDELEPKLKKAKITVRIEGKSTVFFGDRNRTSQIIRILVDNAIKYSHTKSRIFINIIDQYKGKYNTKYEKGVLIQVIDKGLGIKDSDMEFLFTRFFRADSVKHIQGTGLGLSIAKELTTLHKGKIFAESEYGAGSRFSVFLPHISKEET
ncbi:MAG: PAS domain S-box protein [Candidatus Hodarchaeales archaeon]